MNMSEGCHNILDTLKITLGDDLLRHLPMDTFNTVSRNDSLEGYVPLKIEFGSMQYTRVSHVKVYAYMSTSSRQKDLPEIHFYSRSSGRSLKRYQQQQVSIEGTLHVAFNQAKDLSASAITVLLQCIFMVNGATFPPDCAISKPFIKHIRTICYRYMNHAAESIEGNTAGSGDCLGAPASRPTRFPSNGSSSAQQSKHQGQVATMPANLVTKITHKRPYASLDDKDKCPLPEETTDVHRDVNDYIQLLRQYKFVKTNMSDLKWKLIHLLEHRSDLLTIYAGTMENLIDNQHRLETELNLRRNGFTKPQLLAFLDDYFMPVAADDETGDDEAGDDEAGYDEDWSGDEYGLDMIMGQLH